MLIVTYPGSGMRQIETIFKHSGHDLQIVGSVKQARSITFDRLLLLGGADIDPSHYGQSNTLSRWMDSKRDNIELILADRAIRSNIPVLGICRGHQMLAIASGGTLHQDIPYDIGVFGHQSKTHDIIVNSPLDAWIPTTRVNSYHHQAVDRIPKGFKVLARSQDGIIESIYRPGYLGVQFHPEYLYDDNWHWIFLFRWFIDGLE
jgi:putative glutamine amidotransferase